MSIKDAAQAVMKKVVQIAPDAWMPGGSPDPLIRQKHGLIGTPVSRLDGPQKVGGTARFAAEFPMQGMVYAALKYSTVAKGRIRELDTAETEAAPGVVLVMTHRNAPRMKPTPVFMSSAKAAGGDDLPIMQDDEIHWNGQPIAVVLAETQEQADYAKSLIRVAYQTEPSVTVFEAAKADSEPGVFQGEPLRLEIGNAEASLAAAPHKVDVVYRTPRHSHNPIELHAATVAWNGDNHRARCHAMCDPHCVVHRGGVWHQEEHVHVTSPYVGGGFGSKTLWQHQVLAAAASELAGRPVRLMLSREGVYRIVGGRTLTEQRMAIGAQADGRFDAIIQTGAVAMGRHNNMPEPFILPARSAYKSGSFKLDVEAARMDMLTNTFMRAPGESVGVHRGVVDSSSSCADH
jgi:xanthine dehydrogenase YagR molybdenum-binding subunit